MRIAAFRHVAAAALALMLGACTGVAPKPAAPAATRIDSAPATTGTAARRSPYAPAQEDPGKRGNYTRGGLYAPGISDSAPDDLPDIDLIPEPEVRAEPFSRYGNRSPYVVLGKAYSVLPSAGGYDETGIASFYGSKFHGRRTSNLEVYDMYAFTAAHKTLPLPSYARVTNLANGKSVVVRINDRGPFHDGRIIDLSYAAAVKLGVNRTGTARVEVQGLGGNAPADAATVATHAADLPPTTPAPASKVADAPPSAIDRFVAALPIATANAGERPPQASVPIVATAEPKADGDWRFDMRQDGRTMTADEFDAWMRARRARVATGKPRAVTPAAVTPAVGTRDPVPPPAPVAIPPVSVAPTAVAAASTPPVVLQVASFAAHANAERALAMLTAAGIGDARLFDAQAEGRKVWRLRVGPVASDAASELVARIVGLGFGQPQRVRE